MIILRNFDKLDELTECSSIWIIWKIFLGIQDTNILWLCWSLQTHQRVRLLLAWVSPACLLTPLQTWKQSIILIAEESLEDKFPVLLSGLVMVTVRMRRKGRRMAAGVDGDRRGDSRDSCQGWDGVVTDRRVIARRCILLIDDCLDTGGEEDGDYPDKDGGEEDNLEGDIPGMHNDCCVLMVCWYAYRYCINPGET